MVHSKNQEVDVNRLGRQAWRISLKRFMFRVIQLALACEGDQLWIGGLGLVSRE